MKLSRWRSSHRADPSGEKELGLLEVAQPDTSPGWECCKQGSDWPWLCLLTAWQAVTHSLSPLLCCLSKLLSSALTSMEVNEFCALLCFLLLKHSSFHDSPPRSSLFWKMAFTAVVQCHICCV